jgi:Flp pilus assembly protein TadG
VWKDQRGQSLTEFALIVPVLMLLICAIIDFGLLSFGYMDLHMIAQESARLGGLGQGDAAITQYALDMYSGSIEGMQVLIQPDETLRKSGDYVTVSLLVPFDAATPVFSNLLPLDFNIEADSTIRVE